MLAGRRAEARAQFDAAKTIAERDASSYELALAEIGLGRVDGDEQLINSGLARLTTLDVLAPPPGL
jgi:hypothetical protein